MPWLPNQPHRCRAAPAVALSTYHSRCAGCQKGRGKRREQSQKDLSRLSASSGNILSSHQTDHLPPQPLLCFLRKPPFLLKTIITLGPSPNFCLEKPLKGCCSGNCWARLQRDSREQSEWSRGGIQRPMPAVSLHGATALASRSQWVAAAAVQPACGVGPFCQVVAA